MSEELRERVARHAKRLRLYGTAMAASEVEEIVDDIEALLSEGVGERDDLWRRLFNVPVISGPGAGYAEVPIDVRNDLLDYLRPRSPAPTPEREAEHEQDRPEAILRHLGACLVAMDAGRPLPSEACFLPEKWAHLVRSLAARQPEASPEETAP